MAGKKSKWEILLTSQVLNEVIQFHLAFSLDAGAVHVGIEEDDGKSKDEDGVGVPELAYKGRVTDTVPLAVRQQGSSLDAGASNLHLPTICPSCHHNPFPSRNTPLVLEICPLPFSPIVP